MKLFVVTAVNYDEEFIVGVFDSEEKARKVKESLDRKKEEIAEKLKKKKIINVTCEYNIIIEEVELNKTIKDSYKYIIDFYDDNYRIAIEDYKNNHL